MTEAIWQRYSPFRKDAKLSVVLSSAYGLGHAKTLALPSLAPPLESPALQRSLRTVYGPVQVQRHLAKARLKV